MNLTIPEIRIWESFCSEKIYLIYSPSDFDGRSPKLSLTSVAFFDLRNEVKEVAKDVE